MVILNSQRIRCWPPFDRTGDCALARW